jgi:acetylornithine/N-succinyldiaminopimelate aminotransferase
MKIINKYGHYIMPFYMPAEFIVKKAKGSHVWDTDGKKFIDLTAGIAVTSLGHSNSELNNIVSKQTKSLWHLSNLYINEPSVRLASKLCKNTFGDKVFFSNSGAEAIEAAVKTARKYSTKKFHSKKNEIVSFTTSFHGRTLMGITLAHSKALDNGFGPLPKGIKSHKYNSTQGLDKVISDNTSAILLEVVQWQSGITSANIKFIAELKKLAKKHNA